MFHGSKQYLTVHKGNAIERSMEFILRLKLFCLPNGLRTLQYVHPLDMINHTL